MEDADVFKLCFSAFSRKVLESLITFLLDDKGSQDSCNICLGTLIWVVNHLLGWRQLIHYGVPTHLTNTLFLQITVQNNSHEEKVQLLKDCSVVIVVTCLT